jgi:hypothetical protein
MLENHGFETEAAADGAEWARSCCSDKRHLITPSQAFEELSAGWLKEPDL